MKNNDGSIVKKNQQQLCIHCKIFLLRLIGEKNILTDVFKTTMKHGFIPLPEKAEECGV